METITLESLKEGLTFKGDLVIDQNFILLPQTVEVSKELIQALQEWEFNTVGCDGSLSLGGDIGVSRQPVQTEAVNAAAFNSNRAARIGESVIKALEESKNTQLDNSDNSRIHLVQSIYDEYMNYIEQLFTHYATHKEINQEELSDTVKELCIFIKENRRFILRVNQSSETFSRNFLVRHTMRTTVLAIVIALQLRMPLSKMVELGITSVLHEIGMLRLPPSIYMTDRKLTPGERGQIAKHPLLGYQIVKDLEFSLPVQLGILEHHEKENGTGYPRKLSSEKISLNAKIISVACSYEAITASRLYKDEKTEFEAMVEILKNNEKQYDDTIIRALLYSVSLFPIGAYVYLSNKKVAVVVDTNPDNPKYPIVQSLTERDEMGFPKTIHTEPNGISIVRILNKNEQNDILKIVSERYQAIHEAQEIAAHAPAVQAPVVEHKDVPPVQSGEMEEVDINMFS
ncbi:MAG: HD-GYP domain-containing protein [Treponema sp.]|nr:HD-GYP domain-containing protein [Treponema sp.]